MSASRRSSSSPLAPVLNCGNILSLLLHLGIDVRGYDFSGLSVWQADLRQAVLPNVNFAGADLTGGAFTDTFGLIYSIAYSPDGRFLAVGTGDGKVHLWRVAGHQPYAVYQGHVNIVQSIAFSPDSRLLAGGSYDRTVRVWDTRTGQILHTLIGHTDWVWSVAFSADETIRLWGTRTGECLQTLAADGPYAGMNISGATGITDAQRAALKALGPIDGR
ncbi:MAG TPA: pentapeptide repeat-containing protein [Roseiflexaceae bacterium]|nr:pentapeptide repeat-containing protein [Roseiflexaceae bacterium]